MNHPAKSSVARPCPNCGGGLFRKTVNPNKPLGMVGCSNCSYTVPIAQYVKGAQDAHKARAQERIKAHKGA